MKRKYDKFMEEMIDKLAEMEADTALLVEQYNYFLKNTVPGKESEAFLKKFRRYVRYMQTITRNSKNMIRQIERDGKIEKEFQN